MTERLVSFFYLLLRDHLPVGAVNGLFSWVPVDYSDPDLERLARRMAREAEVGERRLKERRTGPRRRVGAERRREGAAAELSFERRDGLERRLEPAGRRNAEDRRERT